MKSVRCSKIMRNFIVPCVAVICLCISASTTTSAAAAATDANDKTRTSAHRGESAKNFLERIQSPRRDKGECKKTREEGQKKIRSPPRDLKIVAAERNSPFLGSTYSDDDDDGDGDGEGEIKGRTERRRRARQGPSVSSRPPHTYEQTVVAGD
ncbi:hypothetical protein V9T40_006887 [Parthenolecanium corni]|uniref:Secreted protein n=1 Tax=Parthenolecanium corni TaxID=536013 RepID=A0AAN9Y7J2_9HEMI